MVTVGRNEPNLEKGEPETGEDINKKTTKPK
jgi:hypothetical protein